MSDVTAAVEAVEDEEVRPVELAADLLDEQLIGQLVDRARAGGLQLTGEGGLLQQLTKRVLESALEGEITDHLGYEKHDPAGAGSGNSRNGVRSKTVLTDVGPVEIAVPRDREGSFEPQIVKKRQRRLTGVDEMVLSLSARGLTHGDISAHLAEVYGASVSKQTISTITDKVMDGMAEWQNRPLDPVYPVIFIDCIHVKVRDGQVANRPIYVALAVSVDGTRDILGLWAGDGGEGAKYWLQVLTEIKNRGVQDVCMVVCDGLKGLPDAIGTVWPQAVTQTCVVHLLRASFRYAGRQGLGQDLPCVQACLHRTDRKSGRGPLPGVPGRVERQVPSDRTALGERLGGVRAVPPVRRGDPQDRLHDQRDRERERAHPQSRPSPRALPQRGRSAEMRLHGRHEPGPDRAGTQTLDHGMEARTPGLRHRLRRPTLHRPPLTHTTRVTPLAGQARPFRQCPGGAQRWATADPKAAGPSRPRSRDLVAEAGRCHKPRPCRSGRVLVLVEGASESVSSSDVQLVQLDRLCDWLGGCA